MSCDYQRGRIWDGMADWYNHHVPADTRQAIKDTIQDFVKEWIKNKLDEEGKRAIRESRRSSRSSTAVKPKPVKKPAQGGGKRKEKKVQTSTRPFVVEPHIIADPPPFENIYTEAKRIIAPNHIHWTEDQRAEMSVKMRHLLHWMHVHGETPDADPIHGKHGLPRISSQAAYAAVHDCLIANNVKVKSSLESIQDAVWEDKTLSDDDKHELGHLLEQFEIEMNKKQNASAEQKEEILIRIRAIAPFVYELVCRKYPQLEKLTIA